MKRQKYFNQGFGEIISVLSIEKYMRRNQLLRLIREAGCEPVERDTRYNRVERTESAFAILV